MATVKVDAEKEGVALAKKYNVGSYPTVLFLDSEGEVWGRLETYLQPDGFAYYVEEVMFAHGIYPSAKKALKSSPSDGKANCQIARVHAMRGNLKLASAALRIMEAAKYKSDDAAKAYNVVGDRYQTEDKFDEAIMCFEKADQATGDPKERSYALTSLIYCYLGKQDLDSAKKYARLVIGLKGADKEYVGFAKTILDRSNKGFQHMIKPPLVWGQRHS